VDAISKRHVHHHSLEKCTVVRFGFALVGHSRLSFPIERSTFKTAGGPAYYARALTLINVTNHHPMIRIAPKTNVICCITGSVLGFRNRWLVEAFLLCLVNQSFELKVRATGTQTFI
jgi:hypothetical protein